MQRIRKPTLLSACLLLSGGCASVPDTAPKDYHLAKAALDRALDHDVDGIFPETMDRAEAAFEEALDIYTSSSQLSGERRADLLARGQEKAADALRLAEKAIELDAQVRAWDSRIESKAEEEQLSQELRGLREKLVVLDTENRQQMRNARMGANIKGPLAFFDVNESSIDPRYNANIQSLAETLRDNPNMQVTLIGHADKSGSSERNAKLSEARAENIARILRKMGVAEDQIMIDAQGSQSATAAPESIAEKTMDRRVDVFLMNRSAADVMTTGR